MVSDRGASCANNKRRVFLDTFHVPSENSSHLEQAQIVDLAIQIMREHREHARNQGGPEKAHFLAERIAKRHN